MEKISSMAASTNSTPRRSAFDKAAGGTLLLDEPKTFRRLTR